MVRVTPAEVRLMLGDVIGKRHTVRKVDCIHPAKLNKRLGRGRDAALRSEDAENLLHYVLIGDVSVATYRKEGQRGYALHCTVPRSCQDPSKLYSRLRFAANTALSGLSDRVERRNRRIAAKYLRKRSVQR